MDAPGSQESATSPAHLTWQTPETGSQERLLGQEKLVIGRGEDCDICVVDEYISRHHAEISWEEGHYVVTDLGSVNGTRVNKERITGERILQDGDRVKLGTVEITFHHPALSLPVSQPPVSPSPSQPLPSPPSPPPIPIQPPPDRPTPSQPFQPPPIPPAPSQPFQPQPVLPAPSQPIQPSPTSPSPSQPFQPPPARPTPSQPVQLPPAPPTPSQPVQPSPTSPSPSQPVQPQPISPLPSQPVQPPAAPPPPPPTVEETPQRLTHIVAEATYLPYLEVCSGSQRGYTFKLVKDKVMIGRSGRGQQWDLMLQDRAVSRPQAQIARTPEGFVLTDLNSANGTLVNGKEITAPHVLKEGDVITFGETAIVFRIGSG